MKRSTLIVRLKGGLGNQMFQYAAGLLASKDRDVRLLFDISSYQTDQFGRKYELDIFNTDIRFVSSIQRLQVRSRIAFANRNSRFDFFAPKILVDTQSGHDKPTCYDGTTILDGYWQSYDYYSSIEQELRAKFSFKKPAANEILGWREQIINSPNATMLHIRRADYVDNSSVARIHGSCTLDYYHAAIDYLVESGVSPNLFVFTDDPTWVKQNIRFDVPMTLVSSADSTWPDHDEMRLMALCKHFIIANSSFSSWSAWLGNHSRKKVIAPSRWYADRTEPAGFLPSSWHRC